MGSVYLQTKFGANQFRSGGDTSVCVFSKLRTPSSLILQKMLYFGPHSSPRIANVYSATKFDTNIFVGDRETPRNKIQDGGRRHLGFYQKLEFGPQ